MPGSFSINLGAGIAFGGGSGAAYDYYVNPELGDDSNPGTSPSIAFATISRALVVNNNGTASIGLARGQRHIPPTSNTGLVLKSRVGGYGTGHMPFMDCSLPVTAGDITAHGTHANVYVVEITHAVAPVYVSSGQKAAGGPHVNLWWETAATGIFGQLIKPHYTAVDTAAGEQFVKDNPSRCFVQKVGSSLPDVRSETSGSTLRYTFQLADSSDPRSGGTLRYACYRNLNFAFWPGAVIRGVAFGRNGAKDLSVCATAATTPSIDLPVFRECLFADPGCHANVGPSHWRKCVAYSRSGGSMAQGGSGWHNYTDVFEPRVPICEDSYIYGFYNALYSHGIAQNPVIQSMQARRIKVENCAKLMTTPTCVVQPELEDVQMSGVSYIFAGPGNLTRFSALLNLATGVSARAAIWEPYQVGLCGQVADGVVKFGTAAGYITDFAPTQADAEAMGSPTLRRITLDGITAQAGVSTGATQRYINYVFDNVAGVRTATTTDPNSTNLLFDATMSNSYIGPIKTNGTPLFATLAEYQAKVPGVGNDVVMYATTKPVTFAGDPLANPTITGPAEILGLGMGVDPAIVLALPTTLANVPTLQSMGVAP